MTEKRFTINVHRIYDNNEEIACADTMDDAEILVDLLNGQEEEIQRLKIQLQTDDVCNKCKHEYLVQQNDGYYISKCKKGFDECSKGTIKYCEDFELKGDVE